MLKKLLLLTFAAFALAACDKDKDDNGLPEGYHYASENPYIVDGLLTGRNMHFFGTSTATNPKGGSFTDDKAYFEFAGGSEQLTIYMHTTRFVAEMPPVEMRIPQLAYTGTGNAVTFQSASIVPEALVPALGSYQPKPQYTITALSGSLDGTLCRVEFTCMGFKVNFEGRLIDNN